MTSRCAFSVSGTRSPRDAVEKHGSETTFADAHYDVWLLSSDPSFTDQINDFVIEGVAVADPDGMDHVDEFRLIVEATDGRLTVEPAASAQNAKISAIEVLAVPSGSN